MSRTVSFKPFIFEQLLFVKCFSFWGIRGRHFSTPNYPFLTFAFRDLCKKKCLFSGIVDQYILVTAH